MNRLLALLVLIGYLALPALAQTPATQPAAGETVATEPAKQKLEKPIGTVSIGDLETYVKTLDKDQLPAYADSWWALVEAKDKEVQKIGAAKLKAKGAEAEALLLEITAKIEERSALVQRL